MKLDIIYGRNTLHIRDATVKLEEIPNLHSLLAFDTSVSNFCKNKMARGDILAVTWSVFAV